LRLRREFEVSTSGSPSGAVAGAGAAGTLGNVFLSELPGFVESSFDGVARFTFPFDVVWVVDDPRPAAIGAPFGISARNHHVFALFVVIDGAAVWVGFSGRVGGNAVQGVVVLEAVDDSFPRSGFQGFGI
jgi:hypothetical protein